MQATLEARLAEVEQQAAKRATQKKGREERELARKLELAEQEKEEAANSAALEKQRLLRE